MACELICIGTNVDGIKNIIQNKRTGLTVKNTKELKTTLLRIFKNVHQFKNLGKNGRRRVLRLNSIDAFFKQELKLIGNL